MNNKNNSTRNVKGQVVNNQDNVPEIKPVIPTGPVAPTNQNVIANKENIETLDL